MAIRVGNFELVVNALRFTQLREFYGPGDETTKGHLPLARVEEWKPKIGPRRQECFRTEQQKKEKFWAAEELGCEAPRRCRSCRGCTKPLLLQPASAIIC